MQGYSSGYGTIQVEEKDCAEFAITEGAVERWEVFPFRSRTRFLDEKSVQIKDGTVIRADKSLFQQVLQLTPLFLDWIKFHLKQAMMSLIFLNSKYCCSGRRDCCL